MDERLKAWRPTKEEVERIRVELRPLIQAFARRDEAEITRTTFLRHVAKYA